jgi:hypothetical protein
MAAKSRKRAGIQQERQADSRVGGCRVSSQISIRLWKVTGHCGNVDPLQNKGRGVQSTALGKEDGWWYTWTGSHLIREPFGTIGLKEGALGVVGERSW